MDLEATVLKAFAERAGHDGSSLAQILADAGGDTDCRERSWGDYRDLGEATLKGLQERGLLERDRHGWWMLRAGVVPMQPAQK